MIRKIALIISMLALLCGCSSATLSQDNSIARPANPVNTTATLTEAAASVSRSLVSLAEIEQAAHPLARVKPELNPASYGMSATASVDWSGPVEPLVRQLASATKYRVRVLGSKPAIPVLVTLSEKNVAVADILRDAAFQCGKRAQIVVLPANRVIEIRYANL